MLVYFYKDDVRLEVNKLWMALFWSLLNLLYIVQFFRIYYFSYDTQIEFIAHLFT